jgi:hypothetical protein
MRGGHQPRGGPVRYALSGPGPRRGQERVLQAVLGDVEPAQAGDEQGEQARPVFPVRPLDCVVRVQVRSYIPATGRISTTPSGSSFASAIAASRSAASIR